LDQKKLGGGVQKWSGPTTFGPLPRAKFHVYRSNVLPLWGRKPILGPLSKNNTGMAALHAGLPVKTAIVELLLHKKTTMHFYA